MPFLIANWRIAAGIASVLIVFGFGYYKGYSHEKLKFEQHLNADATALAVAKAENQRRTTEQQIITNNVTKEYADAVSKINQYYKSHPNIVRVCNDSNNSNTLPSKGQSAGRTASAIDRTSETIATIDLQKIGEEIRQCQLLIEFEKRQDEVQ